MKHILFFCLLASSLHATKEVTLLDRIKEYYPETKVLTKVDNVISRAADSAVYHDEDANFFVQQGKTIFSLEKAFIGKELREIPKTALASYLAQSYMTLNQCHDGKFSLQSAGRLPGGGAFGAAVGVIAGKTAVHVIGHGAIYLIAAATGPAAPATGIALEVWFGPAIEATSIYVAGVAGITLAVASGPV